VILAIYEKCTRCVCAHPTITIVFADHVCAVNGCVVDDFDGFQRVNEPLMATAGANWYKGFPFYFHSAAVGTATTGDQAPGVFTEQVRVLVSSCQVPAFAGLLFGVPAPLLK